MADDVALHFRSARLDGVAARAQVAVRPRAVVDGLRIRRRRSWPYGPEQLLGDLLQALVQFAPEDLLNRSFRTRAHRSR